MGDILGHVSARIPGTAEMFIRCLGGRERGLLYTDVEHVRRLDFSGQGDSGGYRVPLELPIHGELYRARPDIGAVVHAHPYNCLICSLAGVDLRPIYGAYEPFSLAAAMQGIPLFPRSVLINNASLARELMAVMGERDCCLMKGHGITVACSNLESATLLALRLEHLAKVTRDAAGLGRPAPEISVEDARAFQFLLDEGFQSAVSQGYEWAWAYYTQVLRDSVGLPAEP